MVARLFASLTRFNDQRSIHTDLLIDPHSLVS